MLKVLKNFDECIDRRLTARYHYLEGVALHFEDSVLFLAGEEAAFDTPAIKVESNIATIIKDWSHDTHVDSGFITRDELDSRLKSYQTHWLTQRKLREKQEYERLKALYG